MKITITQFLEGYVAECTDLPGSPPGRGPTPEAAVIELFFCLLFAKTGGPNPHPWADFFKYEQGYGMNCSNYTPVLAPKFTADPVLDEAKVIDRLNRAVDEIFENAESVPFRDHLKEVLTRHFKQPTAFEVAFAMAVDEAARAGINCPSPNTPDLVDPSILSKPVMTDQECFAADLGLAVYWGLVNKKWLRHSSTNEQDRLNSVTAIVARAIANVRARNTRDPQSRDNGEPCRHPGCANHLTHPCEGCGRIGAQGVYLANRFRGDIENYSMPPSSGQPTDIPPVIHVPVDPVDPDALRKESEQMITTIKERSALFVLDNCSKMKVNDANYRLIEAAMLIGASIAMERSASASLDKLEGIFRAAGDAQKPVRKEGACCENEDRSMNGGCKNCGDPAL